MVIQINAKWVVGVVAIATLSLPSPSAQAVQFADGTVHFAAVPRLVETRTTNSDTGSFGATYYFTLTVPADAGEPLARVAIAQKEGFSSVRFLPQRTRAFEDIRRRQPIAPSDVQVDKKQAIAVSFNPPIAPGQTVVIGLRPRHNPRTDGVYLFGVTAFPAGEKSQGQFLGFGRLHFYQRVPFHHW
ncbi:MAG: DUF2808 domain-containing protein [Thermosynechococcaceae cyanobacterium]